MYYSVNRKKIRNIFFFVVVIITLIVHISVKDINRFILFTESKVEDNISCHYVTEGDVLISAEDIIPPPDSIFFHETSCKRGLNSRQACSVESVARLHPDRYVFVFFNSPISNVELKYTCLSKLKQFRNVELARLHTAEYTKDTPLGEIMARRVNEKSSWPIQHTADMLRFVTLYKYGGIYLDTDLLVVKPLGKLGKNWAAKENLETVNIAIMASSRNGPGRDLILTVLKYIEKKLQQALKEDKGTGCEIPNLDPFAKEVTQFDVALPKVECSGQDWVRCYLHECRVEKKVLETTKDIQCEYRDIIYVSDGKYIIADPVAVLGDDTYTLKKSDHVKVKCTGKHINSTLSNQTNILPSKWTGHAIGYRSKVRRHKVEGREGAIDVLIFGFDSTSKNGFIRRMPKSYKFLTEELGATVLNGYNIVGDGTPAALFPILTGKTELELPDVRKSKNRGTLDSMPFLFYKLKKEGYRTAYFEDMPWIGTFQYRFNGFKRQPADHYLRAFFLEESSAGRTWWGGGPTARYCVGDTPRYKLMMNITEQFLKLPGKHFAFTFVADITHDDFNMISTADDDTVAFLRGLRAGGALDRTALFFMGDHGPRYAKVRDTLQGKLEERLPLMAIHLPRSLTDERTDILPVLKLNANALTTPHDIYATLLDAMNLKQFQNSYIVPGADLCRGLSLFEPIPRNRSCSEAGIEPHWCACLAWEHVSPDDAMHARAAAAFVEYINELTAPLRSACTPRVLLATSYVSRQRANGRLLAFAGARDADGYVGSFDAVTRRVSDNYQIKVTVGPGTGIYEASAVYYLKEDKFVFNIRDISRVNAYNNEPSCISATHPHLNMYCYCKQ